MVFDYNIHMTTNRFYEMPIVDVKATGKNIQKLMDMHGYDAQTIQQKLSLSCVQTVYRWLDGSNLPSIDNLYALSKLFGVTMDSIVVGRPETIENNSFYIRERHRIYNCVSDTDSSFNDTTNDVFLSKVRTAKPSSWKARCHILFVA